jgi:hypothetical protein
VNPTAVINPMAEFLVLGTEPVGRAHTYYSSLHSALKKNLFAYILDISGQHSSPAAAVNLV